MGLYIPAIFAHGPHGIFHVDLVFSLGFLAVHCQRNLAVRTNPGFLPAKAATVAHKHIKTIHLHHPLSRIFGWNPKN